MLKPIIKKVLLGEKIELIGNPRTLRIMRVSPDVIDEFIIEYTTETDTEIIKNKKSN